ncbi:unnamed protein product [Rotaria magnacalcarata]|uniref:Membrane protein BRI3 n=1 Tax=Rotaria magnacalcarata TaxID=392030 RepID=A0A815L2K8_9BILA|nr:unnamed protein product [Rotaria magnacalcarata]CAF3792527.1 unnamed protein product [Rotaria magnacalcarata]
MSDQSYSITNENDNPPTYQDAINQRYGTFINPSTTTNAPPYPYTFDSQQPTVVVIGGCPVCKVGMLDTEYTCFGLYCAFFCFPIGILCCLALRQRRCNFCGATLH